jgi:hypothetical protein
MAFLTFDLKAGELLPSCHSLKAISPSKCDKDLMNLFNWNTKQLFLYLTIEYETPSHVGRDWCPISLQCWI